MKRFRNNLVFSLISAAFAALLFPVGVATSAPLSEEPERVIYQVYVRAFYDSNGDMAGDFRGIENKLSYFTELGVDTLLLMPIFDSSGGMGYIPFDYFELDKQYGSLRDLKRLTTSAHSRGIKIIVDAPLNHIGTESKWFREASGNLCDEASVKKSERCDFFYFSENPCAEEPYKNWHKPWNWERTDCTAVWYANHENGRPGYYYATFFGAMPDLKFWDYRNNTWNKPLIAEIQRFFKHWGEAGVDGYRIDAAKHFVESEHTNANEAEPKNLALLKNFLDDARRRYPDTSFLAEAWASHNVIDKYVNRATDMVLDFPFMETLRRSVSTNHSEPFRDTLLHFEKTQNTIEPGTRVVFAGNHDVSRMYTEWQGDEQKSRLAMFLTLTSLHTPLFLYGEELGMEGRVKRPDPNNPNDKEEYVRTVYAFPWHGRDQSVGFPGNKKPIVDIPENYRTHNLEKAREDSGSFWNFTKTLIALRKGFDIRPSTRMVLNRSHYGHVLSYTLTKKDGSCRTIVANFDNKFGYDIDVKHVFRHCGDVHRIRFSEKAKSLTNSRYRLESYGKLIIDN